MTVADRRAEAGPDRGPSCQFGPIAEHARVGRGLDAQGGDEIGCVDADLMRRLERAGKGDQVNDLQTSDETCRV